MLSARFLVVVFAILALASSVFAIEKAALAAYKTADRSEAVVGQPITISINVFNLGESPAYDVLIDDESFAAAHFQLTEGTPSATIEKIMGGENRTISYTGIPLEITHVASRPAKIEFKQSSSDDDVQIAFSTDLFSEYFWAIRTDKSGQRILYPPGLFLLTQEEFDRQNDKHYIDMFIVFAAVVAAIGIPFSQYRNQKAASISFLTASSSKKEAPAKKGRKSD